MNHIAKYTFQGLTSKLVPYTGPLYRARPFIKWLMIVYLVVMLVISTLILREQSVGDFLKIGSFLPLLVLVWLFTTRTRREETTEPIEVYFYPTCFSVVKPQTPVKERGKEVPRRDAFTMDYDKVKAIRYDLGLKLVTISGRLHSEFFDYAGEARPGVPPRKEKTVDGAAAFWYTPYMDPALNEEILALLTQYTGKEVDRFGGRPETAQTTERKDNNANG